MSDGHVDYDLCDRIEAVMEAAPDRDWTPSQIARQTGVTTHAAFAALDWMVRHRYIASTDRGHWSRYLLRRR